MTQGMTASIDKFISDPHLGHENMIKFERTQLSQSKSMKRQKNLTTAKVNTII